MTSTIIKAQEIKPKVEECIYQNAQYIKQCKLQEVKETYHKKEVEYYFYQVGKGKFEKEIQEYANNYIENAKLYCSMKTAYSFAETPKNETLIPERLAECLTNQYKQLGINLRLFTDTATKTIKEQTDHILKNN